MIIDEAGNAQQYTVEYLRYRVPGKQQFDTLLDALDFVESSVEYNTCAPTKLLNPDGRVLSEDPYMEREALQPKSINKVDNLGLGE